MVVENYQTTSLLLFVIFVTSPPHAMFENDFYLYSTFYAAFFALLLRKWNLIHWGSEYILTYLLKR